MQSLAALLADPATSPLLSEHDDSVEFIHPSSANESLRLRISLESELSATPVLEIIKSLATRDSIAVTIEIAVISALPKAASDASPKSPAKRLARLTQFVAAALTNQPTKNKEFVVAGYYCKGRKPSPPKGFKAGTLYPIDQLEPAFTALFTEGMEKLEAAYAQAQTHAALLVGSRVMALYTLPLCAARCMGVNDGGLNPNLHGAFQVGKLRVLVNMADAELSPRFYVAEVDDANEAEAVWQFQVLPKRNGGGDLVRWYFAKIGRDSTAMLPVALGDTEKIQRGAALFAAIEAPLLEANARHMDALALTTTLVEKRTDARVTMAAHIWQPWLDSWRWMGSLAKSRDWKLTPLHIKPPATEAEIRKVEADHGIRFPKQLRAVLTTFSSSVAFGWHIPNTDQPSGDLGAFYSGGMRDCVWDLHHIDEYAISNFLGWKDFYFSKPGAEEEEYEEPNPKAMWEHQFPIASLANGDMLTLDCQLPGEPVRYFSHEIEGLHGRIIAPDFVSFVTEYAKLGCLGSEQIAWLPICDDAVADAAYGGALRCDLRADTTMAKRWLKWLTRDPNKRAEHEAPRGVPAKSEADFALHAAAVKNNLARVTAAIKAGAAPDCVRDDDYMVENMTALWHAASHNNIEMMAHLIEHGASINTRKLALNAALQDGELATVQWLIEHGSRVNGWEDDRHWPLHTLIEYRKDEAPGGDEAYFAMLDLLLKHGADPNAPWDNGITMLMRCGPKTAEHLLAHGADPTRTNVSGYNALHWANDAEMVALYVAHGAPINAYSTPRDAKADPPCTALHYACRLASDGDPRYFERIEKLIALGADCSLKDGRGRSAIGQCRDVAVAKLLQAQGESLTSVSDEGFTVLQVLADHHGCRIKRQEKFIRYAIENGVNINATDKDGKTVLHWAAKAGELEDVALLLDVGADKTIKDASGKLAHQHLKASQKQAKALLK